MDLAEASEFSLMAGNLLYYKSKELLPHSSLVEDDENINALPPELVYQLLEYKKFQLASNKFKQLMEEHARFYIRQGAEEFHLDEGQIRLDVNLADLIHSFVNLMSQVEEDEEVMFIEYEKITVTEKIEHIKSTLNRNEKIYFYDLFMSEKPGRIEIVTCFLAMLELMKQSYISILQNALFGVIEIIKLKRQTTEVE
jgi:segregation and condensation protein A